MADGVPNSVFYTDNTTEAALTKYGEAFKALPFEEISALPFFTQYDMPVGFNKIEVPFDMTDADGEFNAAGTPATNLLTSSMQLEISLHDKIRKGGQVPIEDIFRGRWDNVARIQSAAIEGVRRKMNYVLFDRLLSNALTDSGVPRVPVADSANWGGANDTKAPKRYGANTFSAGHVHVEHSATDWDTSVATAIARILAIRNHIEEHGYGKNGIVAFINPAQEITLLGFANTNAGAAGVPKDLSDKWLTAGRVSSTWLGITWIVNPMIPAAVMLFMDANIKGSLYWGIKPTSDRWDDKDKKLVVQDYMLQFGEGILDKYAGYVAYVS